MPIPAGFVLDIGIHVHYTDVNGVILAAVVTAIRDIVNGVVRLTVFNPGATLTDVDQVSYDAGHGAQTWSPILS